MAHPGTQLSFTSLAGQYRPRRPERTVLYQAVAGHYRTFETLASLEGKRIPKHVTEEFETFLRCGILAHGFLRLRCEDCDKERFVAFSCKKRGFCSSCGGRRMNESAAHLVDQVFPKAGVRQWVLSFPMPVRFILAKNPKLQARALTIIHRAIATYIRSKAKAKGLRLPLQPGAVTLIQRFGGSLNLNVHYHMIFLEGGYYSPQVTPASATPQGPRLWWIDPPTDAEVRALVLRLAQRTIRMLKKQGYFRDEEASSFPDDDMPQDELLPELQAASVQSKIALGERRGQRVRRLGALFTGEAVPELKGPLCASVSGFSLHAAVYCAPWERAKLEKLCRYITRPAVAEERLSLRPSGEVVLILKTPYSDGTSHLLFSGLEFVEKLAALIPPPRIHLTRYFGCLAPHAKIRSQIVPKRQDTQEPEPTPEATADGADPTPEDHKKTNRIAWATLLARVFAIDMKHCADCGGELKIVAAILEREAIHKILTHLDLPFRPPDIAPARLPAQLSFE